MQACCAYCRLPAHWPWLLLCSKGNACTSLSCCRQGLTRLLRGCLLPRPQQGVQGISDIITIPGLVNVDFADVKAIMCNSGTAMLGVGVASGKGRAEEAALVRPILAAMAQQLFQEPGGCSGCRERCPAALLPPVRLVGRMHARDGQTNSLRMHLPECAALLLPPCEFW